jgi:regulator-associated protein of mTOR
VDESQAALLLEPAFFCEERHDAREGAGEGAALALACGGVVSKWRMKDRMKTMSVALIMCLNIGVDPPDVLKIMPCARAECWINPLSGAPAKALDAIGKALQAQYERWQPRARYKAALDPTAEDVRKLCLSCRRNAKNERVLVHYTGHGVPRPTPNGEIWVFNKSYTQYIPLSIFDLHAWTGTPAIYVLDCSGAGHIVNAFAAYSDSRGGSAAGGVEGGANGGMAPSGSGGGGLGALLGPPGGGDARAAGMSGRGGAAAGALLGVVPQQPPPPLHGEDAAAAAEAAASAAAAAAAAREVVLLAACSANELLPCSPDLPADVFTACLTSPIKMALRWFCLRSPLRYEAGLHPELADAIPGQQNNRKTPLGELNWIFTAITDTIAWNELPRHLFQRLFRQDLLVASLFRNYLLAERVMRAHNCTPLSSPALPPTAGHPMWAAWDMALEACLLQLPGLLAAEAAGTPAEFVPSPFFSDQLSAFEVWLEHGGGEEGGGGGGGAADEYASPCGGARAPPEQLPIVLQVLLSQSHRLRALVLLGRYLDKGPWAVDLALSVGIFPYVLKLLQTTAADLRHILVFIWTKILALDRSCQADLVKDNAFVYFLRFLDAPDVAPEERALAAFVLACICDGHPRGQAACAGAGLAQLCLGQLAAAAAEGPRGATLLRWLALALAKLWHGAPAATAAAFEDGAPEALAPLLTHPAPELRAAGVAALTALLAPPRTAPLPPAAAAPPQPPAAEPGAAAAPAAALPERDPMSEAERHVAERAVISQLLPLAADGSPLVRREVLVALARMAASHGAHFHAAQMAWQRAGRHAASASAAAAAGGGSPIAVVPPGPRRQLSSTAVANASAAAAAAAAAASASSARAAEAATAAAADAAAAAAAANATASSGAAAAAAKALSPVSPGSRSGSFFSQTPPVGNMSFGDFTAAAAAASAAAGGADTSPSAPQPPSTPVPAGPMPVPPPSPMPVPLSSSLAGSGGSHMAGVVAVHGADGRGGATLFAPAPPPPLSGSLGSGGAAGSLGAAGGGGGGGGGSSLGLSASAGLYASADAARVGGGLYTHVLEALLALAADPAPRVAASGRQAICALGAERLLTPGGGGGNGGGGAGSVGSAGRSDGALAALTRGASFRGGSIAAGAGFSAAAFAAAMMPSAGADGSAGGSYGSSGHGGYGGGGGIGGGVGGIGGGGPTTPSGTATWTQRLSGWLGGAVGGSDTSPLARRGSDARAGGGGGGGESSDGRQSDSSAALALLRGGGASAASLERGGRRASPAAALLAAAAAEAAGEGAAASMRGGGGAAAAMPPPALPQSAAFDLSAVHFSRPLLAPSGAAAAAGAAASDEAAVEEEPEAPPPGVPAWAARPDAAARRTRRAAAAERAARTAAAPPPRCTELLAAFEPDCASSSAAATAAAASALCMHPLRPLLMAGDASGVVRVYSLPDPEREAATPTRARSAAAAAAAAAAAGEHGGLVSRFRGAAAGRAVVALHVVNPYDDPLLLVGAADGGVRVWRDWASSANGSCRPSLASAWRALPGALPTRAPPRWPAAFSLQQEAGCLYAAGEAGGGGGGALHVWDLGREACADALPISTLAAGAGVTCLSAAAGALLLGGASDGRLLSFDLRAPARLLSSARLHTAALRGVLLQPGGAPHALVTASSAGELVWSDLRAMMEPLAVVQAHKTGGLAALAGHACAPVVATGSAERCIRVFDVAAQPLGCVKYAAAFLAQRIAPVTCLSFSPNAPLLAAGGADGSVGVYGGGSGADAGGRRGSADY